MIAPPLSVDLSAFGYLGMRHVIEELRPWERFLSGRPAVADEAEFAEALEQRLADLEGCEAATLTTSTLHVFSDLAAAFADEDVAIFLDEYTYPIARWGVERAALRGTPVVDLPHHDVNQLESALRSSHSQLKLPIVIVDAVSPISWSVAPLSDYLQCLEPYNGLLIVDDTKALGLLGHSPTPHATYGLGGGGSLRWHEIESPNLLLVASLTKGFGVPVAVASGTRRITGWFRTASQTRIHCSPPSAPALSALEHALDVNETHGDELRQRLAGNVRYAQELLLAAGLPLRRSFYPVQSVELPGATDPAALESTLRARGVRVAFQQTSSGPVNILLIITADHDHVALELAVDVLEDTLDAMADIASEDESRHPQLRT